MSVTYSKTQYIKGLEWDLLRFRMHTCKNANSLNRDRSCKSPPQLLLKFTLFRTNHCSLLLVVPQICSDMENKGSFGDLFFLQMLNLIWKEKVILRGLGRREEGRGCVCVGGRTTAAAARKRADSAMLKVRQKHKSISGQQQHWAKCTLCLSDVVEVDGFVTAPSCFFFFKSHYILTSGAQIQYNNHCLLFHIKKQQPMHIWSIV